MLEDKDIKKILTKAKIVTAKEFTKFHKEAEKKRVSLIDLLIKENIVAEETVYEVLAKHYKIPFIALKEDEIKKLDSQFSLYDSLSTKVPFGEPAFTCEEILAEIKKLKNNPYPRKILNIEKLITKFNASLPVSWGQK